MPKPGSFYKDYPESSVKLDDGGYVDVWTSAPDKQGRVRIHLSISTPEANEDLAHYRWFATVDGIDVIHYPETPDA